MLNKLTGIYAAHLFKRPKALQYLYNRKIDNITIQHFKLGYCENNIGIEYWEQYYKNKYDNKELYFQDIKESLMFYEKSIDCFNDIFNNRIVIPIRKDGNTITFTSRSISDSKSPHLHRKGPMDIPLNFDILKNCQTIFVTEGPFDCMTLHQMGYPSIAIFGCNHVNRKLISNLIDKKVYIAFDNDTNFSGNKGALKFAAKLASFKIKSKIITFPLEGNKMDANQYFMNHTVQDFSKIIKESKEYKGPAEKEHIPFTKKNTVSIVDTISKYIDIIYTSGKPKAICPFHSEKKPSLVIYEKTDSYYCFGCGKGGNALNFVKEIEATKGNHITLKQAQEKLNSDWPNKQ